MKKPPWLGPALIDVMLPTAIGQTKFDCYGEHQPTRLPTDNQTIIACVTNQSDPQDRLSQGLTGHMEFPSV